jgi:hypothetical protein
VTRAAITEHFFGTKVTSPCEAGSPIAWKDEWQGRPYEDKGTILKADPGCVLEHTHDSPVTGPPGVPEATTPSSSTSAREDTGDGRPGRQQDRRGEEALGGELEDGARLAEAVRREMIQGRSAASRLRAWSAFGSSATAFAYALVASALRAAAS